MGDMADAARDAEERGQQYVEDVLIRAGHTDCALTGKADLTTDSTGTTVIMCGCYEVFDAPALNSQPKTAQQSWPDEPPWDAPAQVDGEATEVSRAAIDGGDDQHTNGLLHRLARQLDHVDPTAHYTPEMLEQQILDVVRRIDAGTAYEAELIGRAYEANAAYELAFAEAVAREEGGAEADRKARAMVACRDAYNRKTATEMAKKIVAAAMHNLRASLSGYQSVLSSIKSSMNAGGSPGPNGRR